MPWLPIYALDSDFSEIRKWLNSEESIAYIVSAGNKKWVAVDKLDSWISPRIALWHVPSGPLPLLADVPSVEDDEITDPWSVWTERRTGADPTTPFFGAGHPGIVWFNLRERADCVGLSSFEWIGNHYRIIGNPANVETEKWWRRLSRRIKRDSVRIPRSGPLDGSSPEIWTFPTALAAIQDGLDRDSNP